MSLGYPPTPGVLLAGGLARRVGGGDKPLREIGGRTLLSRVIDCMGPQCDGLVLNANGDPARFASYPLPVAADSVAGFPGPMAGILAGLDWMATHKPAAEWMVSVACDCPFLPDDLVARLHEARLRVDAELAVAVSGGQVHPVIGLWPVKLREPMRRALIVEDMRRIVDWTARFKLAKAEWSVTPIDPFFNANTAEDITDAERILSARQR